MAHYSPTRYANLVRADSSGVYFIRAHVRGKLVRRSLKTKSLEIAKLRLDKELTAERSRPTPAQTDEETTIGSLLDDYLRDVRASTRRATSVASIVAAAKVFDTHRSEVVVGVNADECIEWMADIAGRFSSPYFNRCLGILRGALDLGVARGLLLANPCAAIHCRPVVVRERALPTRDQLQQLFDALRRNGNASGHGNGNSGAYYLARFLCYTGFRLSTARAITPAMIDRPNGLIIVDGALLKTGQPGRLYRFPILPALSELLDELDEKFGKERERLLPTRSALWTLRKTCLKLGIPPLTHHTFRHIFSTYCLDQGVPVPVVAQWRGDRDGGKTLLRVYHHLIDDTSRRYAATVKLP